MTGFDVAEGRFGLMQFILRGEIGQAPLLAACQVLGIQSRPSLPQMLPYGGLVEGTCEQTDSHLAGEVVNGIQRAASHTRWQIFNKPDAYPSFADELDAVSLDLHRSWREVVHQFPRSDMKR